MKIKLKRLHNKNAHVGRHYNNYQYNPLSSEYGYKDYRIRAHGEQDWDVFGTDGTRLNPITTRGMSFKEAKEWLNDYLIKGEK